jgi:hypothetical protein
VNREVYMPSQVRALPRNSAGYPVPWFVATIDGAPDFRVIRANGIPDAYNKKLCWVCGQRRSAKKPDAFVIGPMCAVNRVSAEPPSHLACAIFAAQACPFLSNPNKVRREAHMPEVLGQIAGTMIERNPGVALVYVSRSWKPFRDPDGAPLFNVGAPLYCYWFAEGRTATRAEVTASLESGLPLLREVAERESPDAVAALDRLYNRALTLVPA